MDQRERRREGPEEERREAKGSGRWRTQERWRRDARREGGGWKIGKN